MKNTETEYWDDKASEYDNHLKKSESAYLKIIELIKSEINKTQTLLDIGTGTGEIPIAIADHAGEIIANDFSQEMINLANTKIEESGINNVRFQIQDCHDLDYKDEMFDVIIASNLLHLLDRPEQFLSSLKRILKKNGILIIPTFLHSESLKTKIISQILKFKGHPINTRFDSNGLIEFITHCGFKVEKRIFLKNIMPILFVVATKE